MASIEEFYELNKDKLNVPFSTVKLICESPFIEIRDLLSQGKLHDFMLSHLGKFMCNDNRVRYYKKHIEDKFNEGKIDEKIFNKVNNAVEYQKVLQNDYKHIGKRH